MRWDSPRATCLCAKLGGEEREEGRTPDPGLVQPE